MVSAALHERQALRIKCRSRRGNSADLEVLDLSIGGAMVEARGWAGTPGERMLVTLPGLSAQPGELVWIEDGRAGIAFEQPLHETVFDKFDALVVR
ncbi:MAG: PilZ domain-containing protein [Erythrobacter sp.]|nr:MAG: PilZ domain-containing protein [Erythrobacter sp.]